MSENEIRTVAKNIEIRKATNSDYIGQLAGVAISFNQKSQMLDNFYEIIDSHALNSIDLNDSDIVMLNGHNYENPVGRNTKNLHLQLKKDGLHFILDLIDSQESRDLLENVKNGIVSGCSFGFTVADDNWDGNVRTVTKISKLFELSAVVAPAYKTTTLLQTRSLEMAEDTKTTNETQPDLQAELDALKAEIESLKAGDSQDDSEEQTGSADDKADDVEDKEKEETRNMVQQAQPQTQTETRSFIENLKSMETRSGITSADAGVLVPKSILQTVKVPTDTTDLANHVNKVQVKSGVGVLPVLAKNNAKLVSAAEMAENPEITGFSLIERDYKLVTYRGALALSKEIISDAPNVEALVSGYIQEAKNATEEQGIADVLKQAKAVSVADVKALKQAFNTGLANYKDKMWVVSESFYNTVDTLQDNNGRFLLQDSIASASGVSLFGAPIIVVPDTELGADGEAHAFIGSLKQFVAVPYKDDVQVAWVRNENFEEVLAVAIREAFVLGDSDAGKFITFGDSGK